MLATRLSYALEEDTIALPASGQIAVVSPPPEADLSVLPKDRVTVVSRQYPVHSKFKSMGYETITAPADRFALSILCLPRAKSEARAAIADIAPRTEGPVVIDGQITDGVESLLKELKKHGEIGPVTIKAHGKLFAFQGEVPESWAAIAAPVTVAAGRRFQTGPGVFSADGVDPGSAALANALPKDLKGRVIDLGAGWGYLSDSILKSPRVTRLELVEADHAALEAARANITDPRASFHWTDALTFETGLADHVVSNPPFHTGRSADPALGQAFIKASARLLKPKSRLWLVANRHLPYERTLNEAFRVVNVLSETNGFKVSLAQNPRISRKG